MKRVAPVALLLLFAIAGCSKGGAHAVAPVDAPEPPPPPALLVDVALPSLDAGLAGVRQFAEALQPGAGAMISERQLLAMTGVGTLDGAAADRPVHVLLVQPETNPKPLAVLVSVADEAKLQASAKAAGVALRAQGGHALLGDPAVVAVLATWSLDTLSKQKAPAIPVATAFSAPLLAAYRDDIVRAGARMKTATGLPNTTASLDEIADYYVKAAISLLESSERLELRVEAGTAGAGVSFGIVARKGSKVDAFIAAQSPSDFALLGRLPAGRSQGAMAGKLLFGPARADLMELLEKVLVPLYRIPFTDEVRALLNTFADGATGEVAATFELQPGGMRITQLVGATDGGKLHAALGAMFKAWGARPIEATIVGIKTRYTTQPDAVTVDGVRFHRYTSEVDTTGMTPEQAKLATPMGKQFVSLVGGWDDVLGLTMGGDAAATRQLVAASRGKAPRFVPSARIVAELADARARRESVYYFFDLGSILSALAPTTGIALGGPLGFTMTLGFEHRTARLRFAVTTDDVKTLRAAAAGAK